MTRLYFSAALLLVAMLPLTGCAGGADEPARVPSASPDADTAVADAPTSPAPAVELPTLLAADERAPGVDTLAVLDRLPEPQRVEEETRENRHVPGAVDTLRTHHYEGLAFTVVHAANGKELLQEVHVTGEEYATEDGLRVGASRTDVEETLGEPVRTEGGAAVYEIGEPTPDVFRVRYENDRVAELRWSFYVD